MATTSIWSVKGWLGKVVIYVENPEKTRNPVYVEQKEITEEESQGLSDVIAYAVDEEKTRFKKRGKAIAEEVIVMQQYVSGVNCAPAYCTWRNDGSQKAVRKSRRNHGISRVSVFCTGRVYAGDGT